MLTQEQLSAVKEMASKLGARTAAVQAKSEKSETAKPAPAKPAPRPPASSPVEDAKWAQQNLRWRDDTPIADLANVVRIFERHGDFVGRYGFDRSMGKVINRGTVMLGWQVDELAAIVQERFMPGVREDIIGKGLMIVANRNVVELPD